MVPPGLLCRALKLVATVETFTIAIVGQSFIGKTALAMMVSSFFGLFNLSAVVADY